MLRNHLNIYALKVVYLAGIQLQHLKTQLQTRLVLKGTKKHTINTFRLLG